MLPNDRTVTGGRATPVSQKSIDSDGSLDDDRRRRRCCCCRLTVGLTVAGVLELVALLVLGAVSVVAYVFTETAVDAEIDADAVTTAKPPEKYGSSYRHYNWIYDRSPLMSLVMGVLTSTVGCTVVILMLIGLRAAKSALLVPHMICQAVSVLVLASAAIWTVFGAVSVSASVRCSTAAMGNVCTKILLSFVGFVVLYALAAAVQIYTFIMTVHCYRQFRNQYRNKAALYLEQQRNLAKALQQYSHEQYTADFRRSCGSLPASAA